SDCLACPRCGNPLTELRCASCQLDFPRHDGVPWLVADPDATRFEWRNRWQLALKDLEKRQQTARSALGQDPTPQTRTRLDNLAAGYAAQHGALKKLLAPLGLARPANLETYLALKTRLPTSMGLLSYDANVFRDWVWGEAENQASLDAVSEALAGTSPRSMLVLGAGAGRLAYDLHQNLATELTVALELNPYLTTVAHRMAAGDELTLTEFPLAPSRGDRSAIERVLSSPAPARAGFEVVLADARRPPFLPGSFDVVLTPWLLDVIDTAPGTLLAQINGLLTDGGTWIYHGSVAFDRADVSENLNIEELTGLTTASGFEVRTTNEATVPYLDCPDSRHGRRESVLTLMARRISAVEAPPRQQSLPDWIARGREPVPLLPAFQSQAMVTRVHAFVMSLIDGKRSLKDMAALMEAQRLMPREDAEEAIRGFLIKMLDEASSTGGR
ncbi:MAG: class I SAM-dependent methyltransferase, partial [Pseudomonadales bacterium]